MLSNKQIHRLFALSDSIKLRLRNKNKFNENQHILCYNSALKFLQENNLTISNDPIASIHKLKSRYKINFMKLFFERKDYDYCELYSNHYIKDKDIIS